MTKYYSEILFGGACVAPHQRLHKHRMLGLYSSITSLRASSQGKMMLVYFLTLLLRKHVHTGEGPPVAFHGFLVRD